MSDAPRRIADIEEQIDALADTAERCRKIMVVARAAVLVGFLVFVATLLGILPVGAAGVLGGITAFLAGIALYGTHRSTLQEIARRMALLDTERDVLIDGLNPKAIEE